MSHEPLAAVVTKRYIPTYIHMYISVEEYGVYDDEMVR